MTPFDAPAYWEHSLKRNAGVRGIRHTDLGTLFLIEMALMRLFRESPTTEIMVCRKVKS
jgi:hypothetical protein